MWYLFYLQPTQMVVRTRMVIRVVLEVYNLPYLESSEKSPNLGFFLSTAFKQNKTVSKRNSWTKSLELSNKFQSPKYWQP